MTPLHRMSALFRSRATAAAIVITLLFIAGPVSAITLCASSAQELSDDLGEASDNGMYSGQDVDIEVEQGTYYTTTGTHEGPFVYQSFAGSGHISVTGGWTNNCSISTADASTTILDGNGVNEVLSIVNESNDIYVEFLTIQNGSGTSYTAGGVTLMSSAGSVNFLDNIVKGNYSNTVDGGIDIAGGGSQVSVIGNVVAANSAAEEAGAGVIERYTNSPGTAVTVRQNTFYNNTTKSGQDGGLYCCNKAANASITGNIFWDNTGHGINLDGVVDFEFNDAGTMTGPTPNPNISNLSINPQFVDAATGNYRLASNSPLLGAFKSPAYLLHTDLAGDPYPVPVLGFVDIGAYEDTIFTDHGFEGR